MNKQEIIRQLELEIARTWNPDPDEEEEEFLDEHQSGYVEGLEHAIGIVKGAE